MGATIGAVRSKANAHMLYQGKVFLMNRRMIWLSLMAFFDSSMVGCVPG